MCCTIYCGNIQSEKKHVINEFLVVFEPQCKVQNQKPEISGFLPRVAYKKWQNMYAANSNKNVLISTPRY